MAGIYTYSDGTSPRGRSYGGAPTHYGNDYEAWVDNEVFLAVQIESAEAVRNAEAILSVPGVDGCWIGPADLAKTMGIDLPDSDRRFARLLK